MRNNLHRNPTLTAAMITASCLLSCAAPLPERPRHLVSEMPHASRFVVDAPRGDARDAGDADDDSPGGELHLRDVLTSVDAHLPALLAARQEIESAAGRRLASEGAFDTVLRSDSTLDATGFYETERLDVELEQPVPLWGGSLFTGYRLGQGDFAIYDGKAKTNAGGEVRVGARLPLLQGRDIDKRRAELWQADIARDRADPNVERERLGFLDKAAAAYWKWRAAGEKLGIVRQLLQLARERRAWLQESVAEGMLAEISLVDNERLVMERETLEVSALRAFEAAAIELSLYFRDRSGVPVNAGEARLPSAFPGLNDSIEPEHVDHAIAAALARRVELQRLQLDVESARIDLELHRNGRLPKLDLELFASQDLGASTSPDKDPFELGAGLKLEFPLLTREARGKERQAQAKLNQLSQELVWARDRIEAEVRDAASAMQRAGERIDRAERALALTRQMEEAERELLAAGTSDLLRVNLREDQRAKAETDLVQANADYFAALASYRVAQGLPPGTTGG